MPEPNLILLAGPNGAGKSTAAPDLLCGALNVHEFVNADVIARGLSAFRPEAAAMAAGRVMLARLRELTKERKNVAFESTLASRTFAPWIKELRKTGYQFHLFYFWLPSADRCIKRASMSERRSAGTSSPRRPFDDAMREGCATSSSSIHRLLRLGPSSTIHRNPGGLLPPADSTSRNRCLMRLYGIN